MQQGPHSDASHFLINSNFPVALLCSFMLFIVSGCAMNETQQRTGTGAAIGALGGALLGTSRESAAIGAAVGAAGGYLYDQSSKRTETQAENDQLRRENQRLKIEAENQP
jgi:hypothetical protein